MKRRLTFSVTLTLSLLLGLTLWSVRPWQNARAALAANYPLDPSTFTSLGASPFGAAGTYTINASKDNATPILTKPDNTTINGVFFNSSGGEIAVFTFDTINIPANVTVQGLRNAKSRPIALLSKGSFTLAGTVDVSGDNGNFGALVGISLNPAAGANAGPGGGGGGGTGDAAGGLGFVNGGAGATFTGSGRAVGGAGGSVSAGAGGGGGQSTTYVDGAGGGFGGNGGTAPTSTVPAGTAYGNLATTLQGGSGGGGPSYTNVGTFTYFSGAGGGGAIEIGASAGVTITGSLLANGGECPSTSNMFTGGGGAGGGILMHGSTVDFSGAQNISARGGSNNRSAGGGGGRIHVIGSTINEGCIDVSGGFVASAGVYTFSGTRTLRLNFDEQPTTANPQFAFDPVVKVSVRNACGPLADNTTSITLALGNNPTGATLGGTLTKQVVNGVATFDDLKVSKIGTGYTLIASSNGLSNVTSDSFNVVCQTLSFGTSNFTDGTLGTRYTSVVVPTPFRQIYTFTVTQGALPDGLTFISNPGEVAFLDGTPTASGTFDFTLKMEHPNGCAITKAFQIIIACPSFTVGTPTGTGTFNQSYNSSAATSTAAASGYKYQYSLANSTALPSGLTLNPTTGAITGTPMVGGNFSFDLKAELLTTDNVATGCSDTKTRSINIPCPSFTVGTPTGTGTPGVNYSSSVAATPTAPSGFKYQYSLANNTALPNGLTLDATTGAITGTPTASGNVSFDLKAELVTTANVATGCSDTKTRSINITCPSFAVGTPAATSMVGTNYSSSGAVSSAAPSGFKYQYALANGTTLPNGLTLDGATGVISGTPTVSGSFSFDLKADLLTTGNVATGCSDTKTRSLNISCPSFTVGTPTNTGAVGAAYSSSVAAGPAAPSGFKYQYTLVNNTTLPSGLTLDGATGGISGTPAVSGSFSFDLKAELLTSGNVVTGCSDTQTRSLNLSCPSFAVGTPTTTGTLGGAYSSSGAASPAAASGFKYQYSLANNFVLPPGLTLDAATGVISGTPTASGSFSFDLKAELRTSGDGATGCSNTQTRTLNVSCASNPVVTNLNDSGAGSLRNAMATACAGSTITFAPGLSGTLTLTSGDLAIYRSLTIQGPGAHLLTISGNNAFRLFYIDVGPINVTIVGLNLINGNANGTSISGEGGAIYIRNQGTTTLREISISGSSAIIGGAIEFEAGFSPTLNLIRSTLSGNTATFNGGGIDTRAAGTLNVVNSTIAGNQAPNGRGGGIGMSINNQISVNLVNSTITNNQGGGLKLFGGSPSTNVRNTLLALNSGADVFVDGGTFISSGYNLFGTGVPVGAVQPSDQVGVNPLLELDGNGKPLLANNGGPTQTIKLLPGSPALDKGAAVNDPSTDQPLTTDQRGLARPYDFSGITNANSGNSSDIGAYEYACAALTLSALPNGVAGVAYSQVLNASGGLAPYSLSVTSGQLPPGLSLTGNTLAGVPTGAGTAQFTVTVTDGYGCTSSQTYALTVACPPLSLTPVTLPNANLGAAYSQTVTASPAGTTYTYLVTTNTLPLGLSLNNATGVLSGTPTAAGNYSFVITATGWVNGAASCSATRSYNLLVTATCPALTLSPGSLAAAAVGASYSQTFTATGGTAPYNFAITGGTLPPGLTLAGNGALSGTPTTAGTYSFTVTATAGGGCTGSQTYTLTLTCPTITLTPASLPSATAGVAYSQTVTASPAGNYLYSLATGSLPPGISLNATTGALTGLATTTGSYTFSLKAERGAGCSAVKAYTLVVTCPTVVVNPTSLPSGAVGTSYSQNLSATPSGSYTFALSAGALPGGLTLSTAGVLSGTPTASGTFNFTLKATGFGTCFGTRSYTLTIAAACAPVTLPSLPNAVRGVSYYGDLSGTLPSGSYTFSLDGGTLPTGLTLDNLFGALTGTPTASGTFTFTLKATSANGCSGTRSYSVVIGSGAAARAALADYDGDGQADPALWAATTGSWNLLTSAQSRQSTQLWGAAGDVPLLGDYDGDGRTDLAVFRPSNATWYVQRSSDGQTLVKAWGLSTDVPVPGDYDGDGKTDLAVWRGSNGTWYVQRSSDGQATSIVWGSSAAAYQDVPLVGDFDGDGKTDVAVFRRATGTWLVKRSSDGQFVVKVWGLGTDTPVAADYDGDGQTDLAVWRGKTGEWFVLNSTDGGYQVRVWGAAGDVPVVGDYDGDGKSDAAVWRTATGQWLIRLSATQTTRTVSQSTRDEWPVSYR